MSPLPYLWPLFNPSLYNFSYVEDHPHSRYYDTCDTRPATPITERSRTPRPPSLIDRIIPVSVRKSISLVKPSGIAWQPLEEIEIDLDEGRSEIPLRLSNGGRPSADNNVTIQEDNEYPIPHHE